MEEGTAQGEGVEEFFIKKASLTPTPSPSTLSLFLRDDCDF